MAQVKLSVILPNYNYARFFENRLLSILDQGVKIYEIIILDDASTDHSADVIKETLAKYHTRLKNIKVQEIYNKTNSGNVFKQWLKGIEKSTGDLIWICELDDACKKNFLKNILPSFEDNDVILSFSNSYIKNHNPIGCVLDNIRQSILNPIREDRPYFSYTRDGREEIRKVLYFYNTIPNVSAVVFRKKPEINFAQILQNSATYKLSGDWYFYISLALLGKVHYCHKKLNIHSVHSSSVTGQTPNSVRRQEMKKIHKWVENEITISAQDQNRARVIEDKLIS